MIDSLFLLIFRFLSNVRNLNQCSILFTVGLIIHRWYPFFEHLKAGEKCSKKGAVFKKGGNCPEKWDIYEKLPKIAKFDRLLKHFINVYQ